MGKVYKFHHRGWNVDLAVKSPRPQLLARSGTTSQGATACLHRWRVK